MTDVKVADFKGNLEPGISVTQCNNQPKVYGGVVEQGHLPANETTEWQANYCSLMQGPPGYGPVSSVRFKAGYKIFESQTSTRIVAEGVTPEWQTYRFKDYAVQSVGLMVSATVALTF